MRTQRGVAPLSASRRSFSFSLSGRRMVSVCLSASAVRCGGGREGSVVQSDPGSCHVVLNGVENQRGCPRVKEMLPKAPF